MLEGDLSATTVVWLGVLALPLVLALVTAFTKVTVVLGALRVGLGAEAILPMPAVFGLALVVTSVVMTPTADGILDAVETVGGVSVLAHASPSTWMEVFEPLVAFVQRHASPDELEFFAQLQGRAITDPLVLVPAFLVTELTEALAMAVVILVPLVLVDLVLAQILVLLGLVNQPTALVSVPVKLLLFLAVGGWDVVVGGLVEGYR